jgi:anti-sigma regulatory factor (Ser/Thr protein kinase)
MLDSKLAMNTIFKRTITNELHSLESLTNASTNFLEDNMVDPQAVYRINLALEELITNTIKHGYDDYEPHEIDVRLEVLDDEILATIKDDGHAFNPLEQKIDNTQKVSLEKRPIGGLGLQLIRKMLSEMVYRRDGEQNILEVKMHRKLPTSAT